MHGSHTEVRGGIAYSVSVATAFKQIKSQLREQMPQQSPVHHTGGETASGHADQLLGHCSLISPYFMGHIPLFNGLKGKEKPIRRKES